MSFRGYPFQQRIEALRHRLAHHEVLADGASYEDFIRMNRAGQLPEGAFHIWQLDTIFLAAPKKVAKSYQDRSAA